MDKKDIVDEITKVLREKDAKKYLKPRSTSLKVTSEEGDSKKFKIMLPSTTTIYTRADIDQFVDAAMEVLEDCVRNNEPVLIRNEFQITFDHRPQRYVNHPKTGERCIVPEKYTIRFRPGKNLISAVNMASARDFGEQNMSLSDIDYSEDVSEADEIFNSLEEDGDA